jgi:thioredoxin reductase (NADPH)
MLVRGQSLKASMSQYLIDRIAALDNVDVTYGTQITALRGARTLEEVELLSGTQRSVVSAEHVFLFTGASPNTSWLDGCGVAVDKNGFVLTGEGAGPGSQEHETSVRGVFCAGDVRSTSTKRVAAAVGDGAAVVAQIHRQLERTVAQA